MIQKIFLLLCAGLIFVAQDRAEDSPPRLALCELLTHPSQYAGKNVVITARISATKEGASLWDPGCSRIGVELITDPEVRSDPGISALYRELKVHGLSNHPVIATLTGTFLSDQYDSIRHRRRSIFNATSAAEIRQSGSVERR